MLRLRTGLIYSCLLFGSLLMGCTPVVQAGDGAPVIQVMTHTPGQSAAVEASQAGAPTQTAAATATLDPALATIEASLPTSGPVPTQPAPPQPAAAANALPTATFDPQTWSRLPVIPNLSPRAVAILKDGLARGNNPKVFSKIGDCESRASWFLGDFDQGPRYYSLGDYQTQLQPVIDYYSGSFSRLSLAAQPGFTAASLLSPLWADKQVCEKNETPLACEYRVNKPLVAFIMLGSNDASNPKTFEGHLRKALDYTIAQGVLPILGTKADNVEGDHAINATIARLAYEYDLPLWNYWRAVQDLPDHGLQADGVHLTFATPHFDDPYSMQKAWPVRNLNALQILHLVMDQTK